MKTERGLDDGTFVRVYNWAVPTGILGLDYEVLAAESACQSALV